MCVTSRVGSAAASSALLRTSIRDDGAGIVRVRIIYKCILRFEVMVHKIQLMHFLQSHQQLF